MTVEEYQSTTQKNIQPTNTESKQIRSNYLYKGQLDYVKEIILEDCPEINAEDLAEKLDVSIKTASLLLLDCKNKQ